MIKQKLSLKTQTKEADAPYITLEAALLGLKNADEMNRFLTDLLTPAERAAFDERWLIAQKLMRKSETYRAISASTGASTTTVTRVARFLFEERHHGYKIILERLAK